MDKPLAGKCAFVTGAARGLGRAVAEILARDGARLYLVDILADRLESTASELTAAGADVTSRAVDISNRDACRDAVADCIARCGQLDILCNVAGVVRFNHVTDIPESEWRLIFGVNVDGPFWLSQAAIPELLRVKGNIINVTSQAGQIGAGYIAHYAASKGAMVQLTKSMAMEYMDHPIRINAVSPGTMATEIGTDVTRPDDLDMWVLGRYSGRRPPSDAHEVAELVAFVASDRASAIHGAILCADSGVTTG